MGERVVGPEYDALRQRDVIERAEGLFPRRERVVVPEMLEGGVNLLAREPRQARVDHRRHRKPPGEIGCEPAGVGQNETNARETLDRAGENQVHRRARPLVLNFASAHASMRGTNAGGRPCPGWTPTASASTSSLPDTGRRSCCCTRWEARSTAGTASLPPWASISARCATTRDRKSVV